MNDQPHSEKVVPLRPNIHRADAAQANQDINPNRLRATALANLNGLKVECHHLSVAMKPHAPVEVARMIAGLELFSQSFVDVLNKLEQAKAKPTFPDGKL
ncbi:hypothetical protein [Asticcacaulis endophyticus]|uniref:Uncharacterized protein n=1 Tax=Asticcacaulis endophyticus TaxID=1395890 RepID=A0A918Q5S9_9CAUL|nr:hypothetical protein [Asticcacaulis endophyticus]GGZ32778.1 hypothetical protein GCM10011273_18780 [Asticcacaulis endophyticus]